MKTWIVEHFTEFNGLDKLAQALRDNAIPLKFMDWTKNEPKAPTVEGEIIFFGSQEIGELYKGRSGVFLGHDGFLCSKYSHYQRLLNPSEFVKLSYVQNNIRNLFLRYPKGFFIRPDSWKKHFAGQVLSPESFAKSWKNITFYLEEDVDVCISPLAEILAEYRVLCVNNTLITASLYKEKGLDKQEEVPLDQFIDIFNEIKALGIMPDSHCTIDFAQTANGLKLIEFNPLSTSAIYKCNPLKIIESLKS